MLDVCEVIFVSNENNIGELDNSHVKTRGHLSYVKSDT